MKNITPTWQVYLQVFALSMLTAGFLQYNGVTPWLACPFGAWLGYKVMWQIEHPDD